MLKVLVVAAFLIIPLGVASYLWFLNRNLPELNSKVVPVVFLGCIGMLFTIWYSLHGETRDQHFTSTVYFHKSDLRLLDDHESRHHLYGGTQFNVRLLNFAGHRLERDERFSAGDLERRRQEAGYLYFDMAFLKVIDRFFCVYANSWDVHVRSVRHGNTVDGMVSAIKPEPYCAFLASSEFLSAPDGKDAFSSLFSDFPKEHWPAKMTVPPKTKVSVTATRHGHSLVFANPFVAVSIVMVYRGGALGIGDYAWFLGYDGKKSEEFWSEYFEVDCKADFQKWRSGHPDMPRYRRWVDTMFAEIQYQFSDEERMKRAREYRDLVSPSK